MNRELLEALSAVACDYYVDAIIRHPGLFSISGAPNANDEDRIVFPVLVVIDELLLAVESALHPEFEPVISELRLVDPDEGFAPPDDPSDDDIPF